MKWRVAFYIAHKAEPLVEGPYETEGDAIAFKTGFDARLKRMDDEALDDQTLIAISDYNSVVYGALQAWRAEKIEDAASA